MSSSWIERELERERQAAEYERRQKQAVREFWPRIRERLRIDVEYFNRHCLSGRAVDLVDPSEMAIGVAAPGDAERSVTLWLESQDGRVRCRRGSAGEADTLDLRMEFNGNVEYDHLLGDDALTKLSQDLLKAILFPGE